MRCVRLCVCLASALTRLRRTRSAQRLAPGLGLSINIEIDIECHTYKTYVVAGGLGAVFRREILRVITRVLARV